MTGRQTRQVLRLALTDHMPEGTLEQQLQKLHKIMVIDAKIKKGIRAKVVTLPYGKKEES